MRQKVIIKDADTQVNSHVCPRALFIVGMGNCGEAVTASLSAAPLPRAARNPQIMLPYTHFLATLKV